MFEQVIKCKNSRVCYSPKEKPDDSKSVILGGRQVLYAVMQVLVLQSIIALFCTQLGYEI
ncbi:hypothetical protein PVAP13_6NG147600 [Panicum virgatum]|uniref:Uncharacterized protein n=1 Tax=Panicum virgatum TaxID=38727 RepID=A0A8T0R1F5_PANVG|nr:hypothetical protein PVAP13_6NG147600 [Panicum virgatum]